MKAIKLKRDRLYNVPLKGKIFVALFSRIVRVTKFEPGTHMENGLMYRVYRNQDQGPLIHGVNSLDRFHVAMLPCPMVMLSGKHDFKIFQHYGYFASDSAAAGL